MKKTLHVLLAASLLLPAAASGQYQLGNAFPHLTFDAITDIQHAGDGTHRLFVVEKRGVIWVFPDVTLAPVKSVFLDIQTPVLNSGEGGLLGLTFHPDYETNGYFYVFYVTTSPYRVVVVRYRVSADPNVADPSSDVEILSLSGSSRFHNGGQLAFDGDGYLRVSIGDNKEPLNGQDLTTLWGSILRIDVDVSAGGYGIPPDNPFFGNAYGYREEILAYGFRNPWRFTIDHITGRTYVADVGDEQYEEIDTLVAGGNYGWPLMEADDCHDPPSCDTVGVDLIPPYYSYSHSVGVAVIGGQVYRGPSMPDLVGNYIYADWIAGKVWCIVPQLPNGRYVSVIASDVPTITTTGVAEDGEIYFGGQDQIYCLLPAPATDASPPGFRSALGDNFPNPFNPTTTIPYTIERDGYVELKIWSPAGSRVATLASGWKGAGPHEAQWNGINGRRGRVGSGVYFCSLSVDGAVVDTRRMVLLK